MHKLKVKEQLLVNEFKHSIAGDFRAVVLHSTILLLLRHCSVHILKIFIYFELQCGTAKGHFLLL